MRRAATHTGGLPSGHRLRVTGGGLRRGGKAERSAGRDRGCGRAADARPRERGVARARSPTGPRRHRRRDRLPRARGPAPDIAQARGHVSPGGASPTRACREPPRRTPRRERRLCPPDRRPRERPRELPRQGSAAGLSACPHARRPGRPRWPRGRVSVGALASNSGRARSAQSAAQSVRARRSSSRSVIPTGW